MRTVKGKGKNKARGDHPLRVTRHYEKNVRRGKKKNYDYYEVERKRKTKERALRAKALATLEEAKDDVSATVLSVGVQNPLLPKPPATRHRPKMGQYNQKGQLKLDERKSRPHIRQAFTKGTRNDWYLRAGRAPGEAGLERQQQSKAYPNEMLGRVRGFP